MTDERGSLRMPPGVPLARWEDTEEYLVRMWRARILFRQMGFRPLIPWFERSRRRAG